MECVGKLLDIEAWREIYHGVYDSARTQVIDKVFNTTVDIASDIARVVGSKQRSVEEGLKDVN